MKYNDDDSLSFFIPLEIEKAQNGSEDDKYDNMIFTGVASDASPDFDGEVMEPSGYEIQHFLDNGLFNLEHYTRRKGSSKYWIGEPIDAYVEDNKLYVKGKLWKDSPLARDFWDTLNIMKSSGSNRKPGMSIEATNVVRDPLDETHITKATITNVALTMSPVNPKTYVDAFKSIGNMEVLPPLELVDENVLKEVKIGDRTFLILKDLTVAEKTMDVAAISPLLPESVDKKTRNIIDNLGTIAKAVRMGIMKKKDNDLKDFLEKAFKIEIF